MRGSGAVVCWGTYGCKVFLVRAYCCGIALCHAVWQWPAIRRMLVHQGLDAELLAAARALHTFSLHLSTHGLRHCL